MSDDVRQVVEVLVDDPGTRQERRDRFIRNRRNRFLEGFGADARRQTLEAAAAARDLRAAFELNDGPAVVQISERQNVAGENQVRVFDLRVDLPDLRPNPRVAQKHRCDVPQRIAALHHVGVGMPRVQDRRRRLLADGRSELEPRVALLAQASSTTG